MMSPVEGFRILRNLRGQVRLLTDMLRDAARENRELRLLVVEQRNLIDQLSAPPHFDLSAERPALCRRQAD